MVPATPADLLDALQRVAQMLLAGQAAAGQDELLDAAGVMALLKIESRHTLRRWVSLGLPCVRLPGTGGQPIVRYPRAAALEWCERFRYYPPRKPAVDRTVRKSRTVAAAARPEGGGAWASGLRDLERSEGGRQG